MDTTPLCVFASKVIRSNRIVFGDLRRLQRDVLPTGPTSREEIETLLSLDSMGSVDEDWPGYLVATVKDFVLSTSDPPGSVDTNTAVWLVSALSGARPRSASAIARAILRDAQHIDEILLALEERSALPGRRSLRPTARKKPRVQTPKARRARARLEVEGLGG